MIIVAGSANMDLVARVDHQPAPGETLIADGYGVHDGGKGANQAVAAARLGSPMRFVGAVGADDFGQRIRDTLAAESIDTAALATIGPASGIAMISVDTAGENCIIVVPGANGELGAIDNAETIFESARVVLAQLETTPAFVNAALKAGRAQGAETMLNAAPAASLAPYAVEALDWLIVNAAEAALIGGAGVPDDPAGAQTLAAELAETYAVGVVITLGADGAVWHGREGADGRGHVAGAPADVVDTTGAGDTFVGAFAWARSQDKSVREAVTWAVAAGGLSVTQAGARSGMPTHTALAAALA
ncbi:ribokinase [uncultured Salinisphaera sp.]|uniref:ribokinase n=1 Tax=uncultured Salinisphaera sp. TaxID=359372 RepID=UPI0032B2597B|tara:strand:+ start:1045 stop:1953 length:909 start_codon:yes stop_codon:yes gene_type:complete